MGIDVQQLFIDAFSDFVILRHNVCHRLEPIQSMHIQWSVQLRMLQCALTRPHFNCDCAYKSQTICTRNAYITLRKAAVVQYSHWSRQLHAQHYTLHVLSLDVYGSDCPI
jgi:hypothetical protein